LSKLGASNTAKLIWLAPVVAQMVRTSEDILVNKLNLYNIVWLYWSLVFITIGQIIYAWKCPRFIKKYGDDIEKFKIEQAAVMHSGSIENLFQTMVRYAYRNSIHTSERKLCYDWKGMLVEAQLVFPEMDESEIKRLIQSDYDNCDLMAMDIFRYQTACNLYRHNSVEDIQKSYISFKSLVTRGVTFQQIDWNIINLLSAHRFELFDSGSRRGTLPYIGQRVYGDDTNWKLHCLQFRYDYLNQSNGKFRWLVALFYGCAIPYFVYIVLRNLFRMSEYTLAKLLSPLAPLAQ